MLRRPLRRAAVLSLGVLLAFAGTASADSVTADNVAPIVNGSHFLGDVGPGGTVSADVQFVVICAGLQHVDTSQSVILTGNGGIVPLDGAIVSASTATLAPLSIPWGADGQGCPDPVPSYAGGVVSHVVLRAPTTAGTHTFTVQWNRSLNPAGVNDANAFGRSVPSVNLSVRVSANTPPTITVPAPFTAEADNPAGWTSSWSVSAADAEDDPDPTPTCSPAAGTVLPLGVTTVNCSVTDSVGSTATDHFDVTVVDTTAPALRGVPSDINVTTSDTAGRTVSFTDPTATDAVDASPYVGCAPASGSLFPVGTTSVKCTATDASGNPSTGDFRVTVRYVAPSVASALWLEPVAGSTSTFVANRGRTLPIKVQLFVNGSQASSGAAALQLTPCGGGTTSQLPLVWSGGRWTVSLDTSSLSESCYTVTATIGDRVAGSFTLELRDGDAVKALPKKIGVATTTSTSTDRRSKTSAKPH
ncbi:MAG TPA: HYR domain-containing protein [Candidatus Limnocylindrales bacterium]|nr:HYR domain-containing protein [Candidatus Limnocylindrales bacterium]